MEAFTTFRAMGIPVDIPNCDTDQIIPSREMKTVSRSGLAQGLFAGWRYSNVETRTPNLDFVLNQEAEQSASILIAGENFGCGSSREHAPWALKDFGVRSVISTSFADIFYNNCFKNGILPIVLPEEAVAVLMKDAEKGSNARMTIDLENQTVTSSDGDTFAFEVDSFKKHCLMNGLDDRGLTMEKAASIDAFEVQAEQARPWV